MDMRACMMVVGSTLRRTSMACGEGGADESAWKAKTGKG